MIVRAAETAASHVRAAKEGIGAVIFGQDKVIEQALITVLCGGHALLIGLPGLAKTKLVDTMGAVLGLGWQAHPVHPGPDAVRHSGHRSAGGNLRPASAISASLRARYSPSC